MTDVVPAHTALVTGVCALVSGATGFLGSHLAAMLTLRGYRVRALTRPTSDRSRLAELGVELVVGDVTDRGSLERAIAGQRLVFHTAGKVSDWGSPADFMAVNRDGTANVVAACQSAGVERLVHVSSLTVLGLPRDGRRIDEQTPYAIAPPDPYSQSKIAAERLVRAAHAEQRLATTVVRPGVIWGRGDLTIVPRIVALLRRRRMPYIDGGGNLLGLSHVENLALGCVLAAEQPVAAGQLYHVTDGQEISLREALDAIADAHGVPRPRVALPFSVVHAVAALVEGASRLRGHAQPPAMTRYGVRLVSCHCRYDLGKVRRELGYEPRVTFNAGMADLKRGAS